MGKGARPPSAENSGHELGGVNSRESPCIQQSQEWEKGGTLGFQNYM